MISTLNNRFSSFSVSNFRRSDIEEILEVARHKPVINQIENHVLNRQEGAVIIILAVSLNSFDRYREVLS